MIKKRTTFILGAGAHCSYGFPSGEELKRKVVEQLTSTLYADSGSFTTLEHLANHNLTAARNLSDANTRNFIRSLSMAGQASIDAFLDANSHMPGYDVIGKAGIAQVLCRYEQDVNLFSSSTDDDWLSYLFRKMYEGTRSAREFVRGNSVRFITFNYDRTLETWLLKKLYFSYGLKERESLELLDEIPIVHMYGDLGDFPIKYANPESDWINSLKRLKLIHEVEEESEVVRRARNLLADSQVVCLLGFGFHAENMNILDLNTLFEQANKSFSASRYQLTDTEWKRITGKFLPNLVRQAGKGEKCLGALRNTSVF